MNVKDQQRGNRIIVPLGDWEKNPRLEAKTSVRSFMPQGFEGSRIPGFQDSRVVKKRFFLDHLNPQANGFSRW